MSALSNLQNDPEFAKAWPLIWSRLSGYFDEKQREYAKEHHGRHEEIGRFVEFCSEIVDDFESIKPVQKIKPTHKQLNRKPYQL